MFAHSIPFILSKESLNPKPEPKNQIPIYVLKCDYEVIAQFLTHSIQTTNMFLTILF